MPRRARSCIAIALLLACSTGAARAQTSPISTHLNWDHCAVDGRIVDRTFACDTNIGEDVFVGSFPDRIYLQVGAALPNGQFASLVPGQEYTLFRIKMLHAKSTGTGAGAGCTVPTCIGFGQLNLDYLLPKPQEARAGAGLNWVTWQGAYVADYPTQILPWPHQNDHYNVLSWTVTPVPAQGRTWGLIKTMYR